MMIIEIEEKLSDVIKFTANMFNIRCSPEKVEEIRRKISKAVAEIIDTELTTYDTQADNSDGTEADSR